MTRQTTLPLVGFALIAFAGVLALVLVAGAILWHAAATASATPGDDVTALGAVPVLVAAGGVAAVAAGYFMDAGRAGLRRLAERRG